MCLQVLDKRNEKNRLIILGMMLLSLSYFNVQAASTFSKSYIAANKKPVYVGIDNSKNEKTTIVNSWYVIAKKISYNPSNAYVGYGLCFSPMVRSKEGIYSLSGGSYQWVKKGSKDPIYGTWKNVNKKSYYLGVRLDTDFTGKSASSSGEWNAQ